MEHSKYKSMITKTINDITDPNNKPGAVKTDNIDMGGLVSSLVKELLNLKIPVYDVRVSQYRHNVLVLELPFCKSCELSIDPVEFGAEEKQATLYIDKKAVRRIKLEKLDSKYLNSVAVALVDYFKRYLMLKNKFAE